MKKIIGILRPFDAQQKYFVYDNGNKIDSFSVAIEDNMIDVILGYVEKYKITQIDLTGPKQFAKGIVKEIKKAEMKKYHKENLEVNII